MLKIVFATSLPFWKRKLGAHQRICALIDHLVEQGHDVSAFYLGSMIPPASSAPCTIVRPMLPADLPRRTRVLFRMLGWAKTSPRMLMHRAARYLRRDASWSRWYGQVTECERYAFRRYIEDAEIDVVIVEYLWLTRLITGIPAKQRAGLHVILDTHDVMQVRTAQLVALGERPTLGADRRDEAGALARFDTVLAIQENDAQLFRMLSPGTRVITVMHSHRIFAPSSAPSGAFVFLFVGSRNAWNRIGLTQFLQQVWARVTEAFGNRVRLDVVGGVCSMASSFPVFSNVRYLGELETILPAYNGAQAVVAPLTHGTGLKIKVVEALCHSKPLITTPVGAEGLEDGEGQAYLVGDGWTRFAEACEALVQSPDLCRELSQRAYEYAMEHFSTSAAYGPLARHLSEVETGRLIASFSTPVRGTA